MKTPAPSEEKTRAREQGGADLDADRKPYLTLQARAALAGFELVCMADSGFVVGRWGLVKTLPDVAACEAFLTCVGAPQ